MKKKQTKKKVKKEITAAVDQIESVVGKRVQPPTDNTQWSSRRDPLRQKKHRLLWTGVVCLTIVVFATWIWNASIMVNAVQRQPGPSLWSEANNDLQVLFESITATDEKTDEVAESATPQPSDEELEVVKAGLHASLSEIISTSTTSSTE